MYLGEKYSKTFTSLADFCVTDGLLPGFTLTMAAQRVS
jgi:hypothetical protein